MAGPDDDDKSGERPARSGAGGGAEVNDEPKSGAWPPEAEYAVPTGSPDVYDPNYVPPAADPAHDEGGADEGPPAGLYPGGKPTGSYPESVDNAWESAGIAAPSKRTQSGSGAVVAPSPAAPSSPVATPATTTPSGPVAAAPIAPSGPVPTLVSTTATGPVPIAPEAAALDGDELPLPPELGTDTALQAAVGAPSSRARRRAETQPRLDEEDVDPLAPRRSKRTVVVATVSIVAGVAIAALVFLGHANAQHYGITCDASHAVATQGRSFPPWGHRPLGGAEWAPIALPANAECQPRETDDQAELAKWYLAILVDRATVTLTAKDLLDRPAGANGAASPLDAVSAQLEQALLLARDPERRDERKEITRLQGDVEYWRAAARLRDASGVLLDAAKQFEAANQQHPRHATDAAAWSTFLHHLADELHAGPNGLPASAPAVLPSSAPPVGNEPVPVGTALPVEPDHDGGSAVPAPTPDAGIPSGGVLL